MAISAVYSSSQNMGWGEETTYYLVNDSGSSLLGYSMTEEFDTDTLILKEQKNSIQHILTPTMSGLVMNMKMTMVPAAISGLTLGMIQALFYISLRAAKTLTREMN